MDLGWTKASDEEIPDVGMDIRGKWVSPMSLAPRHLSGKWRVPAVMMQGRGPLPCCVAGWHGGAGTRVEGLRPAVGKGWFVTSRAAPQGLPAQRVPGGCVTILSMETLGGSPQREGGCLLTSTFLKLEEIWSQPAPDPFSLELCCLAEFKSCSRAKFSRFPGQKPI